MTMKRTLDQWRTAIDEEARKREWPYRWHVRRTYCLKAMSLVVLEFGLFRWDGVTPHLRVSLSMHELESVRTDWRDVVRIIIEDRMARDTARIAVTVGELADANEYFGFADCVLYMRGNEVLRASARRRGPVHEPVE